MPSISVKLPPDILHLLRTTGLSSRRVAELLRCGPRQACHLLKAAGAKPSTNGAPVKWKMGAE